MPYLQVHVDEDPETVIRRHAIEVQIDCGYDDYTVDQLHTALYYWLEDSVRLLLSSASELASTGVHGFNAEFFDKMLRAGGTATSEAMWAQADEAYARERGK